jgi:hypothetical protein
VPCNKHYLGRHGLVPSTTRGSFSNSACTRSW